MSCPFSGESISSDSEESVEPKFTKEQCDQLFEGILIANYKSSLNTYTLKLLEEYKSGEVQYPDSRILQLASDILAVRKVFVKVGKEIFDSTQQTIAKDIKSGLSVEESLREIHFIKKFVLIDELKNSNLCNIFKSRASKIYNENLLDDIFEKECKAGIDNLIRLLIDINKGKVKIDLVHFIGFPNYKDEFRGLSTRINSLTTEELIDLQENFSLCPMTLRFMRAMYSGKFFEI